jgi:UDP-N-acetylglucosamine acyltransferase
MPHCHIAHDTVLEDRVILSNHCSPGGNSHILEGANLGKGVQTHQRVVIGQYAMLGVGAIVVRNILPAATVIENPARFLGTNKVGLERNGFSSEDIESLNTVLKLPPSVIVQKDSLTPSRLLK